MQSRMGYLCIICQETLETRNSVRNGHHKKSKTPKSNYTTKENVDAIVSTKCGHMFHYTCISRWFSSCYENLKCPTCNRLIYTYELIQLFPAADDNNSQSNEVLRSSSKRIQEMLTLVEYLLTDLEQRDPFGIQDERIQLGSLKPQVVSVAEEALKNQNPSIIRPNGTTILPNKNTLKTSTKEEVVGTSRRVVELLQRQRDEVEDLKKTHHKELRQELLNIHKDLMRSVEKYSPSGLLCSPNLTATSSIEGDKRNYDYYQVSSASFGGVGCQDDGDGPVMRLRYKAVQEQEGYEKFLSSLITKEDEEGSIIGNGLDIRSILHETSFSDLVAHEDKARKADLSDKTWDQPRLKTSLLQQHFRPGDKVAWRVRGQLQLGMVKWKGFVGSTIHAGVEFENAVGLPWTENDIDCLFKSKPGHGYLVPVNELITIKDLLSLTTSEINTFTLRGLVNHMARKIRQIRSIVQL